MLSGQDEITIKKIVKEVVDTSVDEKISRHLGVFMEQMNDQFARVIEAVQVIVDTRTDAIPRIEKEIKQMAAGISSINYNHTQLDKIVEGHEGRIEELETVK